MISKERDQNPEREERKGKIAFVFPGQGSQFVGMGKDLSENSPAAKKIFQRADDALGFEISKLCFEGSEDELNKTINTQPAIVTVSIAALAAAQEKNPNLKANIVAGHSLGEYSALVAAEALGFEDAVRLVKERGRIMQEADDKNPGKMAVVEGFPHFFVRKVCEGIGIDMAALNTIDLTTISGEKEKIDKAVAYILAKKSELEAGKLKELEEIFHASIFDPAKEMIEGKLSQTFLSRIGVRGIPVSIGAHSPKTMAEAKLLYENDVLPHYTILTPKVPIVLNMDAQATTSPEKIYKGLANNFVSTVLWYESMICMVDAGVNTMCEFGPRPVATGMFGRMKRAEPERFSHVNPIGITNFKSIQKLN